MQNNINKQLKLDPREINNKKTVKDCQTTVEDCVKYNKKLIKWTVFVKTCKMTIPGYFVTI